MNNYEERRQGRIDRLHSRAEKAQTNSNTLYTDGQKMASVILDQAHAQSNKADYYAEKAAAAENNNSISSDDPEAVTKLKEKLESLVKTQDLMKACNRIIKSKPKNESTPAKLEKIKVLGLNNKIAEELFKPQYGRFYGFQSYQLSNNNAKISSCKKRIASLMKQSTEETTEKNINGVRVVDNVEDNRLQLFFDGKPEEEIRKTLKSWGFRWSRYNGCWQRQRSNGANYGARMVLKAVQV